MKIADVLARDASADLIGVTRKQFQDLQRSDSCFNLGKTQMTEAINGLENISGSELIDEFRKPCRFGIPRWEGGRQPSLGGSRPPLMRGCRSGPMAPC